MSDDTQRAAIMELHDQWWMANLDLDWSKTESVFAEHGFLQYNLTGHPYFSRDELGQLWEMLHGAGIGIPEISEPQGLRLEIRGDMAWLACENIIRLSVPEGVDLGPIPATPFRVRSTEVYQRNGDRWAMWHFHCSPCAADAEPRAPFGDSFESRSDA